MPDIDLKPDEYRKRDPRTGRWHLPDDPKFARNYMVVVIAILAFIFWHRGDVDAGTLFGVSAMFSFCAGIMFAVWLKDVY